MEVMLQITSKNQNNKKRKNNKKMLMKRIKRKMLKKILKMRHILVLMFKKISNNQRKVFNQNLKINIKKFLQLPKKKRKKKKMMMKIMEDMSLSNLIEYHDNLMEIKADNITYIYFTMDPYHHAFSYLSSATNPLALSNYAIFYS